MRYSDCCVQVLVVDVLFVCLCVCVFECVSKCSVSANNVIEVARKVLCTIMWRMHQGRC